MKNTKIKSFLSFLLLLFTIQLSSQTNDESIYFKTKGDTLTFFLNEVGDITLRSEATYYRIARIDHKSLNYVGKVEDFYINNQKAYECFYENYSLNGEVKSYYANGQVKYDGFFDHSLKDSTWRFYYDNGNLEKIVIFSSDVPYVKEYYKKNGKISVVNGNGKYEGIINSGYKQVMKRKISGMIQDGKFDGKWYWSGGGAHATEYFENGKFIWGKSIRTRYKSNPIISLTGFDVHENVDLLKFMALPVKTEKDDYNVPFENLKFEGSVKLGMTFSSEFYHFLKSENSNNGLLDYYCFIQFTVTKENRVEHVVVYSNNAVIERKIIKYIKELKSFEHAKIDNKAVESEVYLCFFCENGKFFIPDYSYNSLPDNVLDFIQSY